MLRTMRKKGFAKKVLWFVAVIIILSFGVFGSVSYYSRRVNKDVAGKIFGHTVSKSEYIKMLQHVEAQAIIQYGEKFNQAKQYLNLSGEVWDRLILGVEARREGIKINDEEVVQAIQNYPFFKRDGKFDVKLYSDLLKFAFHLPAPEFEDNVRELLKIGKIYEKQTENVSLSEREIFDSFKTQNEKAQVSYILFTPDQFKNQVTFDEAKAKKYFEENKKAFVMPPSISVDYLELTFTPGMTDDEKSKLKDQAYTISDELNGTPDLKATAQKYKLVVKNSGFFSLEKPNLSLGWSYDLINALLALKPKEFLSPQQTASGIIIAQVSEKKDSYLASYDEVKDLVKDRVLAADADAMALKKAEDTLPALIAEMNKTTLADFAAAAKQLNLEIGQTPLFNRSEYLPKIGISREFQDAAFALNDQKKLSEVVKIASGYCILYLDKYVPADEEQFKKEKDKLAETLLSEKKNSVFIDFMTKLRSEANLEDYIKKDEEQE